MMKSIAFLCCLLASVEALAAPRLKVSENKRFLVYEDGRPFFWLGDTAWELFHRLNREEADRYLEDRARKGFTVIQAVAIGEFDGHTVPNAYGHLPLKNLDPATPAVQDGPRNDYWDHVDYVVDKAESLGMFIGLLPTWGRYWHDKVKDDKPLFTVQNAEVYGEWLGRRYKDKAIIWILGGDRSIDSPEQKETIRAMARGLRRGDGGAHLITFHPSGGNGSSTWLQDEPWLDINMRQNGHVKEFTGRYDRTHADYDREPTRPVLDGEPLYEDHPIAFNAKQFGHSLAADVRRPLYWDLFGGACGHTYGNHAVWQFWTPERQPINGPLMPWTEAIDQPGAGQMQFARWLLESRPFLTRVPDDSLIVPEDPPTSIPGAGVNRLAATRDASGSFALVYTPVGRPFRVRTGALSGDTLRAWWFNPRDGKAQPIGEFPRTETHSFSPPDLDEQMDWVLVLDDASKSFSVPGQRDNMADEPLASGANDLAGQEFLITATRTGDTEIFRVDPATGDSINLTRSPKSEERYPCWSPDGKRFAFTSDRDGTMNLYVANIDGGNVRRLTDLKPPAVAYMPSWVGERIVFGLHSDKPYMASIRDDGADLQQLGEGHDPCLSPDGRQIAYTGECPGGVSVFLMNSDGSGKRQLVKEANPWGAVFPCWSPDGRQIAYAAKVGSALEICAINVDGGDPRQLTRLGRICTPPAWSPDGKWISFRSTDERYWSNPARMQQVYAEHPGDKRPVWVMSADGKNPRVVESLRFGCAMDGSRAQWRPPLRETKSEAGH